MNRTVTIASESSVDEGRVFRPVALLLKAGALAGAIGSMTGLLFTFAPQLKPGTPGGGKTVSAPIPGTTARARLAVNGDAVRQLTYRDYLRELGVRLTYAKGNLSQAGAVITYRLKFPGYPKGTPFRVRYELYRDEQGGASFVRRQTERIHLDGNSDYCTCTSDFIALPGQAAIYHFVIGVFVRRPP